MCNTVLTLVCGSNEMLGIMEKDGGSVSGDHLETAMGMKLSGMVCLM